MKFIGGREGILRRIQHLINVAEKSTEEGEAKAAALRAQKLMLKYHVEFGDLKDAASSGESICTFSYAFISLKRQYHHLQLAGIVSKNFRTKDFYGGCKVYFMGYETDAHVSAEIYKFLVLRLESDFKDFLKRRKSFSPEEFHGRGPSYSKFLKRQYIQGYLMGIRTAFEERAQKDSEYALMVITPQAVVEAYEDLSLKTTKLNLPKGEFDRQAFSQGVKDGKKSVDFRELPDAKGVVQDEQ